MLTLSYLFVLLLCATIEPGQAQLIIEYNDVLNVYDNQTKAADALATVQLASVRFFSNVSEAFILCLKY